MTRVEANYRTLLAVANVLNSQRDSQSLFQAITEELQRVVPCERAAITVYAAELDAFRFYAMHRRLSKVVVEPEMIIPRVGSAVGWVYAHKEIHIRPDVQRERVFLEDDWYAQEGLGRMVNLPLLVQQTCLGTLNIGSVQTGEIEPDLREFLQQVATQIAYALDHVCSYEEINRLRQQLVRENAYLEEKLGQTFDAGTMVGKSAAFYRMLSLARAVASTMTTVLLTGETGTGKELLARAIHEWSPRSHKPFIRLNCAALPSGLVESELFGHERGAFTGADHRRAGRFELAHGGTLFLDEVGEMPLDAQAKLLRVLEDGLVDRIGGMQPVPVDVRVIAATNTDLTAAMSRERFRSDLFYRLRAFPITVPPLRERPDDIPVLAQHFLVKYRGKLERPCERLDAASLERLVRYAWPGNIRELEHVIEQAMILCHDAVLPIDGRFLDHESQESRHVPNRLEDVERRHILQTLALTDWRIEGGGGAAERLGLVPSTLRSRLRKLGIQRPADPAHR